MSRSLILFLILHLSTVGLWSQNEYYVKDGNKQVGVTLVKASDLSNAKYCKVLIGENVHRYSPEEVSSYGFKDGQKYVAREIELNGKPQMVFLELLDSGEAQVFFFKGDDRKTFFHEVDGKLVEIPRKNGSHNYKVQLKEMARYCPKVERIAGLVHYNKASMMVYSHHLNACTDKPFPFIRFGGFLAYNLSKLKPSTKTYPQLNLISYYIEDQIAYGMFIDIPFKASYLSFHTEMIYSKYQFHYSGATVAKTLDLEVNRTALLLPLLFRYSSSRKTIRPFVNAGGVISYARNNYHTLDQKTTDGNTLVTGGFIDRTQVGFAAGIGTEFNLSVRNSIYIELRYVQLRGTSFTHSLNSSEYNLIAGFNF
jgi:hypothetical protein